MQVTNDTEARRFVAQIDGTEAVAEYHLKESVIIFTHTEVPRSMRGRGVGGRLVLAALEEAREKGYG